MEITNPSPICPAQLMGSVLPALWLLALADCALLLTPQAYNVHYVRVKILSSTSTSRISRSCNMRLSRAEPGVCGAYLAMSCLLNMSSFGRHDK